MTARLVRPPLIELKNRSKWLALLLLAVGLHVFEAALPSLGPWFKPGLANLVTLLALLWLGPKAAFLLSIGRVIIGSFFIGTLFTPTFIISMAGGIAAACVMIAAWKSVPGITLVGVSLLGAVAHMAAQLVTVETLFIQQSTIYFALPPLLLLSTITGWINGALAGYIAHRLNYSNVKN